MAAIEAAMIEPSGSCSHWPNVPSVEDASVASCSFCWVCVCVVIRKYLSDVWDARKSTGAGIAHNSVLVVGLFVVSVEIGSSSGLEALCRDKNPHRCGRP